MPPKKNIPWTLPQLCVKIGLLSATTVIGLWCGHKDSYSAFYVAVLVQALNNAYESFGLLGGYTRFITWFHVISFLSAVISAIIAVLFFADAAVDNQICVWIIAGLLSVPVLHYLIETFILLVKGKY